MASSTATSAVDLIRSTIGADEELASRIQRKIGTLMRDPEVRAFICAYGFLSRPTSVRRVGGENSDRDVMINEGRREMALMMAKCAGGQTSLDLFTEAETETEETSQ